MKRHLVHFDLSNFLSLVEVVAGNQVAHVKSRLKESSITSACLLGQPGFTQPHAALTKEHFGVEKLVSKIYVLEACFIRLSFFPEDFDVVSVFMIFLGKRTFAPIIYIGSSNAQGRVGTGNNQNFLPCWDYWTRNSATREHRKQGNSLQNGRI